jgi:hypothetical protein
LSSLAPGAALNDLRNLAASTIFAALTRARLLDLLDRRGRCSGSWPHDSMVRSPAAPSISIFSDIPVRADDGARAVGAIDDDDVGIAERRRWWRRRVAQRGSATYRVIDSDRQILQH